MRIPRLALLILLSTALSLVAVAARASEKPSIWKDDVKGWSIRVDSSIGDGCFMSGTFKEGTALRVQINPSAKRLQLLIGNAKWHSIADHKKYALAVKFGNRPAWTGNASGMHLGALPMLLLNIGTKKGYADAFAKELMQANFVRVTFHGKQIAKLSLNGTYAAMQEVYACQKEMEKYNQDPFKEQSSTPSNSDPFL